MLTEFIANENVTRGLYFLFGFRRNDDADVLDTGLHDLLKNIKNQRFHPQTFYIITES
jgi:hypothetical protein